MPKDIKTSNLPSKICAGCQRPFTWRKKWEKVGNMHHVAVNNVVVEALCFGWIDSLPRAVDDEKSRLWLAPHKSGSAWSKLNKERAPAALTKPLLWPPKT